MQGPYVLCYAKILDGHYRFEGRESYIRAINTRFIISWGIVHRVSGDPKRIVLGRALP